MPATALPAMPNALLDLIAQASATIRITEAVTGPPLDATVAAQIPGAAWIPEVMWRYAAVTDGWLLAWESLAQHAPVIAGRRMGARTEYPVFKGRLELLSLKEIYGDWTGVIDFSAGQPANPGQEWTKTFKIVDWIYGQEDCVGIYHDERCDSQLYYCNLEDEPEPLDVDIAGYLLLAQRSLGGQYWQDVLRALAREGPAAVDSQEAKQYAEHMRTVLPSFDLNAFIDCYSSIRLGRELVK